VIALASTCLAPGAWADSSEAQYEPAIANPYGEHTPVQRKEPLANSSETAPGGGSSAPGNQNGGSKAESPSSSPKGHVGTDAGHGNGQGNQGSSPKAQGGSSLHPKNQVEAAPASGEGGSGSSPLVPILIAIAALAALSLGTVLYRQRRQRSGSRPVSPEAS
jgi:cobalamin biosynthesis Mg chelatase CobN